MVADFEQMFGPVIGHGSQATVYAMGDYAVKLYREGYPKGNVFSEAYVMANLERENFPSPRVYEVLLVDGRYGIRMDRVKGKMMGEGLADNPAKTKETLNVLVDLQCRLQKHGNAGALFTRWFDEASNADWKAAFDLNFYAALYGTRAVLPIMKKLGGGAYTLNASQGY